MLKRFSLKKEVGVLGCEFASSFRMTKKTGEGVEGGIGGVFFWVFHK